MRNRAWTLKRLAAGGWRLAQICCLGCTFSVVFGCASERSSGVRFLSAKARRDGGIYAVTAVVENATPRSIVLDELGVEMTTYEAGGKVLARGYPFSFRGEVAPFATTRLPLNRPDREGKVLTSRLYLLDRRGRTVSEIAVGPTLAADGAEVDRGEAPAAPGSSEEFPILGGAR